MEGTIDANKALKLYSNAVDAWRIKISSKYQTGLKLIVWSLKKQQPVPIIHYMTFCEMSPSTAQKL